jgi:RsmE family RNA methyltransferase
MSKLILKEQKQRHEFAFFVRYLARFLEQKTSSITITCPDLLHRLKNVVRVCIDQEMILFDKEISISFIFKKFQGKEGVVGVWKNMMQHKVLRPEITFLLPMLKVEALSEAVYALAEVGITHIQLITTQKTQTAFSDKILEKLERVVIAATEQSKNFAMPKIYPAKNLVDVLDALQKNVQPYVACHFDVNGLSFSSWYKPVESNIHYYLLVGPEGDLTDDEKLLVSNAGFISCLLTQTILRSVRAVSLVAGIFRL